MRNMMNENLLLTWNVAYMPLYFLSAMY